MLALILSLLMLPGTVLAQTQTQPEKMKKSVESLQNAVNEAVIASVGGFGVLQGAKGTYLEGYGIVVTLELALETPRNPFTGIRSSDEIRTTVTQRRKDTEDRLKNLLKQGTPGLDALAPAESATVIIYLLNTNPADLPNLPAQLVFSVRKQDAAATGQVSLKEYK